MQRYPLVRQSRKLSREILPRVGEEAHLVFFDEKGKIRAGCYFGENDWDVFDLGLVPSKVADRGPDAVRAYGKRRMSALIEKEKKRVEARTERVKALRHEFEVIHEDMCIRGVLTKGPDNGSRDNRLILTMSEPFQLVQEMVVLPCNFVSSMSGMRTFDDDGNLLEQEIKRTEAALILMYKREIKRRNKPPAHPALQGLPRRRRFDDDDD